MDLTFGKPLGWFGRKSWMVCGGLLVMDSGFIFGTILGFWKMSYFFISPWLQLLSPQRMLVLLSLFTLMAHGIVLSLLTYSLFMFYLSWVLLNHLTVLVILTIYTRLTLVLVNSQPSQLTSTSIEVTTWLRILFGLLFGNGPDLNVFKSLCGLLFKAK